MQKQERFAVRTVWHDGEKVNAKTTIARNRADAISQAERIGKIDDSDRAAVRDFLEDTQMRLGSLCVCSGGISGWSGVATIYSLDED